MMSLDPEKTKKRRDEFYFTSGYRKDVLGSTTDDFFNTRLNSSFP
jgi:hypothetical protein